MIRHSSSHGLATLICSLASGFIVVVLREFLPEVLVVFSRASIFLCSLFDLPYHFETVRLILVAAVMATLWGLAFAVIHKN